MIYGICSCVTCDDAGNMSGTLSSHIGSVTFDCIVPGGWINWLEIEHTYFIQSEYY